MEGVSSSDSYSTSCSNDSVFVPCDQLTRTSFTVLQELAQGHGDVRIYLVESDTGTQEVLKTSGCSLEREGRMMERVTGRNVVRFVARGQDERLGFWLLLEWCQVGDLFRLVKKHGAFAEEVARVVVSQLVGALQTCHNANCAHLDVKLENCYISSDGTIKIGDFGHSRRNKPDLRDVKAGTLQYQAPEIRRRQPYDGCCADIFSLGVCVFVLLFGRRPWKHAADEDPYYLMYLNRRQEFWRRQTPPYVSPTAKSFIEAMLTAEPLERSGLDEVRTNAWLKGPKGTQEWRSLLANCTLS
jgi:serine/threonine protein kinase